ncbi:aminotransferase class V-fold PLP-dependent enzyme, partial [Klebsiella pneumoniae]|uniref:aminotransferase class V-fold PLP-dependent enzyme n=1 Tax=Klebsiella pneumoniae TaxID=573 RepID=UPI0027320747
NETGVMFPVPELAELAHEQGALFHCDAVQVVGKIPMALSQTRIDMLSCSAHNFLGPIGVGCLWLRRGTRFRPLLRGGHQAHGRRAGTENISG